MLLRPPGDGYLDCFHCLAVMNNAPVNICTPVLTWPCFQIFWVVYPGVELLGHMLVLLFVFGVFFFVFVFVFFRTSILFTTVAVTIYF